MPDVLIDRQEDPWRVPQVPMGKRMVKEERDQARGGKPAAANVVPWTVQRTLGKGYEGLSGTGMCMYGVSGTADGGRNG